LRVVDLKLSDAALVLLGHGSTLNREAGAPVFQHAAELRRLRGFAEVREAFWKQPPKIAEVLAGLSAPRVFLIPMFISEGYFSEKVIPQALGFGTDTATPSRVQRRDSQLLFYCRPIGTHEKMTDVLLMRAAEVIERFPFPRAPERKDITLFVAGHGTEQEENSRASIERQADRIRARGIYAAVHAVFLEEEPRIGACYSLAQTKHLVILPFFMSEGMHVRADIPVLLGEPERIVHQRLQNGQCSWRNPTEKQGKLVWYAATAGTAPTVADIILDSVREALDWAK
jgi:sirohydrochlorin cobaltochelatase